MTETSWTTPSDIRAWLARQWDRGRLLTSVLEQDRFPLRVPFKVPTSRELGTQYDDARAWVAAIQALPRVRLEARRINHRQLGAQDIPAKIWIDTVDDAAAQADIAFVDNGGLPRGDCPLRLPEPYFHFRTIEPVDLAWRVWLAIARLCSIDPMRLRFMPGDPV